MAEGKSQYFCDVSPFLQQGDIFSLDLVTPFADSEQRIFRAADGRHGSVVFADNVEARVFDRSDLNRLLNAVHRTPNHTEPFHKTPDGDPEMVVVFAQLARYFVIATQTCDISGTDKLPLPFAIILPIITFVEICKSQSLPMKSLDGGDEPWTIHDYLVYLGATDLENAPDPYSYGMSFRCALNALRPTGKTDNENLGRIKNFLKRSYDDKRFLYYLEGDPQRELPEVFIDFSVPHSAPTDKLAQFADRRVARIASPYREEFSQSFSSFISRVATPVPRKMAPLS